MKKVCVLLLLFVFVGFVLVACAKEIVSYCPFCGRSSIRQVSEFDRDTNKTVVSYECLNNNCDKKFGAGKI